MSKNNKALKKAVCAFILDFKGNVLTVSRKDDPNDIGLPGGKVDKEDKSEIHALKREVFEETGFSINVLLPIHSDKQGKYYVTTYLAVIDNTKEYVLPSSKETGIVRMLEPKSLLNSSFKEYNKDLLKKLNINYK